MPDYQTPDAESQPDLPLNMPDDFEIWSLDQQRTWFKQRESEMRVRGEIPRYPSTVGDHLRVAEATIWLVAVKVLTAKVSQARWERFLGARDHATSDDPFPAALRDKAFRVQRAVSYSIQHLPGTGRRFNCLVRAVTSKWLLARRGIPTTLYLGEQIITRNGRQRTRKHAWLRCGDRVISGWGPHVKKFTEVARFGGKRKV